MDTQSFVKAFSLLPESENPKQTSVDGIPYILHEDHRWVLPIVHFAQQQGTLPKPCTVIMFDRHHDALDPSHLAQDELKRLRIKPSLQGVTSLCAEHLRRIDDDWLKAGMELGFFGDAAILGVREDFGAAKYRLYTDHVGNQHCIEMSSTLPRSDLAFKGHLSDVNRRSEFESLWKILGWEHRWSDKRFHFLSDLPKILLTIDLDCFAFSWSDYTFAWPPKIFEAEFLERSDYWSTSGWSGRSFLQALAKKAGLVTIARESECTGGSEDSDSILKSLLHYGFEDRVVF